MLLFFFFASELPSCSLGLYLFLRGRFRWNRRPESSLRTLVHIESLQRGRTLHGGKKDKEAVIKERQQAEKVEQKVGNSRHRFEGISTEKELRSVETTDRSPLSRGRNRLVILAAARGNGPYIYVMTDYFSFI